MPSWKTYKGMYMFNQWSVQGLGMLRFYLGDALRLHIWDEELEYPNVSKLHTHSWDLSSTVVCGEIINQRFVLSTERDGGQPYWRQRLVCGVGCQFKGEPEFVFLRGMPTELYGPGDVYSQKAYEIHCTTALPGTITLMKRQHDGPKGEADVFWPEGMTWGTAEPRPATMEEVKRTTDKAAALIKCV